MVTGTQFNCKAVLWDQRKPQYVQVFILILLIVACQKIDSTLLILLRAFFKFQLYFMHLRRMSSPIYSVSFDSSHLYGATDQNVVEVKFTGEPNIRKNYREIMKYGTFLPFER